VETIDDVGEERDIDTVEDPRRLVRMDDLCIAVVLQGFERRVEFGEPTSGRRTASPPPKGLARCRLRSLLRLFLIVPLALTTQFRCVCPECSSGSPAGDRPVRPQQRPACGLHSSNRGSLALALSASPSWLLTMLSCAVARLSVHHDRPSTLAPTSAAVFSSVEMAAKVEP
jgi:hypothetical protein